MAMRWESPPNPSRTLDFRKSSRFPPKPAVPHTVATEARDEKAFFESIRNLCSTHHRGEGQKSRMRDRADVQNQRHPTWAEHRPDLVFS